MEVDADGTQRELLENGSENGSEQDRDEDAGSNQDENEDNPLRVDSRINYGMLFQLNENLNFGLAYERGNTFRASFNIKGNFFEDKQDIQVTSG